MAVIGLAGCGDDDSAASGVTLGPVKAYFWGRWTRMDTGESWVITDKNVSINGAAAVKVSSASTSSITVSGQTLVQESENVARLGTSILLFRNGGAKRSFTARLTGFAAASGMPGRAGMRGPSIGDNPIGNRPTNRTNATNPADSQTTTSGTDGLVTFTNAVSGDPQVVTVGGGSGQTVTLTVNPEFDGQDIGTIPVVEDGYSFKVTSKVDISDSGYLYGNDFNTYTVSVDIKNIGNANCMTSLYEVIPDSGLTVTSGALTGNFSTIEIGATRNLTFAVSYGSLTEEYKDVKLTVRITDAATVRTWVDYVVLRFHKRPVPIKIYSQNLDGVSTATLKGFVVHPDNRSVRFTVPSYGSAMLYVPWSSRPYQMIFSGAGASTEMKYSFVVGTATADLGGTWGISDINAYEPNNSEADRTDVTDGWVARRAYLNVGDIDFYSIDLTAMPGSVPVPTAAAVPDSAYGVAPDVQESSELNGVLFREFVAVPAGSWMQQNESAKPGFLHSLSKFRMGKYEVTYELWYAVYTWAIASGYQFASAGAEGHDGIIGAAPTSAKYEPVTSINWRDAIVWCNAYSQMSGLGPVYCSDVALTTAIKSSSDGSYGGVVDVSAGSFDNPYVNWNATGYRLPTEGEWQYAASYNNGTDWTPYNQPSGGDAGSVGWYSGNSGGSTKSVGTRAANALGIYDMSGNVWEWCWDWKETLPTTAQNNYRGPASGSYRITRGGSYNGSADYLRVGYRGNYGPYFENDLYGFRLCLRQ